MLSKALLGSAAAAVPAYIEDVFSTYLYTGTGSTQTITNGIDLAGKGGAVWIKNRSTVDDNVLFNTVSGPTKMQRVNTTDAQETVGTDVFRTFNSNGFTHGGWGGVGGNGNAIVSWTFREQPKFFDVVTYTGNGLARTIAHNLGSVPGCFIVKKINGDGRWSVYHRSLGNTKYLQLNATNAEDTVTTFWNSTDPTSTVFSIGTNSIVNASGDDYIVYLFAHDAGGFGLTGTDNVISCSSFTTDGSGNATVNLGYEPQWILVKPNNSANNWAIYDTMRGWTASTGGDAYLLPNTSGAEGVGDYGGPTATGFIAFNGFNTNTECIYIAIRRGPMKTPTTGTSVFNTVLWTGNATNNRQITGVGFSPDFVEAGTRNAATTFSRGLVDRLRGPNLFLRNASTGGESTNSDLKSFDNDGITVDYISSGIFNNNSNIYGHFLKRAPGFFDVVCYTGTGSATTVTHNLGVAPELIIAKRRNDGGSWGVFSQTLPLADALVLNTNGAAIANGGAYWNSTAPTSTVFSLGIAGTTNASGGTYVAYLFASAAGVSKVGSYTGNGTSLTIPCGFTAGARFVLIKRTDDVGDWYVWDTARGIVSGNDPHLSLNTTAAEVTTDDTIDPDNSGFIVNQVAATNVNVSSATYIFLAIA